MKSATAAGAASLTDAIPGHAGLTALDLAKLLVTDLRAPGGTHQAEWRGLR